MKKLVVCIAMIGGLFAYEIDSSIETGQWTIVRQDENHLVVEVAPQTCVKMKHFVLDDEDLLQIRGEDLTIKLESDQMIGGAIVCEGALTVIGPKRIEVTEEGKLYAPKISMKSERAPKIHGKVKTDQLQIFCDRGNLDLAGSDLQIKDGILLDPKNVLIQSGGGDSATGNTFASNASGDVTIDGVTLGTAIDAASVTIQANTDITVDEDVTATTSGNNLTLQAGRSIAINASCVITLNNANFLATINDGAADGANRDAGDAVFLMSPNSSIITAGGDVTINAGSFGGTSGQIQLTQGSIDASGGNIDITGVATTHTPPHGVILYQTTVSTTGIGTLSMTGTGGLSVSKSCGLDLNKPIFSVENGTITLTGTGGGIVDTGKTYNFGMQIYNGTLDSTGTGAINLVGNGGSGDDRNFGVMLTGSAALSASSGNITLTGTGGGTGAQNYGVRLESTSSITTTTTGNINFIGIGGGNNNTNLGVILSGNSALAVVDGTIDIDGTGAGSGDANHGVIIESSSTIDSTGTGAVQITGESSATGSGYNLGISLASSGQITVNDGTVIMTGTSHGNGGFNQGINFDYNSALTSTGTGAPGAITITGTSGDGTDPGAKACYGVSINKRAAITSVDADITVNGTSNAASTVGISMPDASSVSSSGTGSVTTNSLPI